MKIDKRKLAIQVLAIIGLILSIKLAMIYYDANYNKYALSSFCSINEFVDCDGAAKTKVSQFLGIPLAYWGMLFYLIILFLTFVDKLKNSKFLKFLEVFKNPMSYISVIGTFAFIVSMVLAGISIFGIKKLCILCVITYFIDFLIALTAPKDWKEYFVNFKTTFLDFINGIKMYPKTFVVLLITSAAFLTYTQISDVFTPHIRKSKELRKYIEMTTNPYSVHGNVLGVENADVVIELYSDFGCPMCYVTNIMLHQAASEYDNIVVVHHNLPFDKECNKDISYTLHPKACFMAKAALAAKKLGDYWGMSTLLYEKQPRNNEELLKLTKELNLDGKKVLSYINSKDAETLIEKEIYDAYDRGLDSTPTIFVNGDKHVGMMPYEDMKKFLEEHGAKRRK